MKRGNIIIASILLLLFLSGCQSDMQVNEETVRVLPMNMQTIQDIPAIADQGSDSFIVSHQIKGNKVFVECIVPSISFRDRTKNKGKIILYVNGRKKKELSSAAFIIEGLPKGEHRIKLQVVKENTDVTTLTKEFNITIS